MKKWIRPVGASFYHLFDSGRQACGGSLFLDGREKTDPSSEVNPQYCEKCKDSEGSVENLDRESKFEGKAEEINF